MNSEVIKLERKRQCPVQRKILRFLIISSLGLMATLIVEIFDVELAEYSHIEASETNIIQIAER